MSTTGASSATHRRPWLLGAAAVALVAVLVVLSPRSARPWDVMSEAPDGTDVMRRVLDEEFDVQVREVRSLAGADDVDELDVVVVFEDRLDDRDRLGLADHVADGGRVVVAAPSAHLPSTRVADGRSAITGSPDCPLLPGTRVGMRPGPYDAFELDVVHAPFTVPDQASDACWVDEDGNARLAVLDDAGGGQTVLLSSPLLVSNFMLANWTGTTQVVPLFVPASAQGEVVVVRGTGAPPPGTVDATGAVPTNLRTAMWLLGLAGGLFLLANGRRLGGVLVEPPVVRVPASELALGVADLLQRRHHAQHAADHVRATLRADVDRVMGTGDAPVEEVVRVVARATGVADDDVRTALGALPVPDDDRLVSVVGAVGRVRGALGLGLVATRPAPGLVAEPDGDPAAVSQSDDGTRTDRAPSTTTPWRDGPVDSVSSGDTSVLGRAPLPPLPSPPPAHLPSTRPPDEPRQRPDA